MSDTNEELKPAVDISKLALGTARQIADDQYDAGETLKTDQLRDYIERALTTATSDAAARIAELEQNLASFHRQHGAQATEMQKLQQQIAELTRERDEAKADTERIANNFVEVQRLYSSTDSHNCELRLIITGVRSELRTVKAEADQLRADLEAAKRERDEANDELTGILRTGTGLLLQESQQREFKLQSDLAAARKRIKVLEGALTKVVKADEDAIADMRHMGVELSPESLRITNIAKAALSTQSESEATKGGE